MSANVASFDEEMEPERVAGGFSSRDGSLAFYQRIDALLTPDMTVLDFGAGPGAQLGQETYVSRLARLQGRVKKLVGVDIDPAVLQNRFLDEAHVIDPNQPLPFADETFDLIYSDWVIEHVENPEAYVREVYRVLRPGGWFCARTPSKWSYIAVSANVIPDSLHKRVLKRAQSTRGDDELYPKFYRMNTLDAIQKYFDSERFLNASFTHNPTPGYHGNHKLLYWLLEAYQSIPLRAFDTTIHVFVQKKGPKA